MHRKAFTMGRVLSIRMLPAEVQAELTSLILGERAYTLNDLVEWLEERGHTVSRSALHRFVQRKQLTVVADAGAEQQDERAAVRLRCLEIAARLPALDSESDLLQRADRLLEWVYDT